MALTKKEQETLRFYDEQAEQYINHSGPKSTGRNVSFWQPELETFMQLLPQGKVLDIRGNIFMSRPDVTFSCINLKSLLKF